MEKQICQRQFTRCQGCRFRAQTLAELRGSRIGGAGWPPFRRALPAISLSFHPDSKTLEWGNSCGQKSVLHGPFEVAATGNYGRRNLGYNLRESLHVR